MLCDVLGSGGLVAMDRPVLMRKALSSIENGFVHLPKEAGWRAEYLHELTVFPNGKHDGQVDSTASYSTGSSRPAASRAASTSITTSVPGSRRPQARAAVGDGETARPPPVVIQARCGDSRRLLQLPKFQQLRRTSHSGRRRWMFQNAQLREHRGLIPIEMLVGHFAGLKPDDAY
jgi:hypothetical protein